MASRVLMVAWDAGDPELIDRWTTDGTLPHLAALRRAGVSGSLNSSAEYLAGSPWPTFYTGQSPSLHSGSSSGPRRWGRRWGSPR